MRLYAEQLSQPSPGVDRRRGLFGMERVVGDENKEDERLRSIVADGVEHGLSKLLTNKDVFVKAFDAFAEAAQDKAKKEAGGMVIGWVKWVLGKAVLGSVIIFMLWYTGGLPAVLTYMKVKS